MIQPIPSVLLIEDNQLTRELYQRELREQYHILACGSEAEALDLLVGHSIEVIILEPALRNGQGWEFLKKLRSLTALKDVPIILCSTQDARRPGLELGATACLTKPVLPHILGDTIEQVIHGQRINGF
jgi:CheY-like chemotaxis protein